MTAKRGTAPCGHPGTHVTPGFITCDQRCGMGGDAAPEHVEPEITKRLCPACGSDDIEPFTSMWFATGLHHCVPCGKVFT